MNYLQKAYLMPHPPIIINEIGNGNEKRIQKTIDAMNNIAMEIKKIEPETIIVITPHGCLFRDAITMNYDEPLKGNFREFGNYELEYTYNNDIQLVDEIVFNSGEKDITAVKIDEIIKEEYNASSKVDHGVLVPLYFINKMYKKFKLVHITYGLLPAKDLYTFGQVIQKSINDLGRKAVVIASGDLSHKLSPSSNAGYSPRGKEFDDIIISYLHDDNREDLVNLEYSFAKEAGECGLKSIQIMFGTLDGLKTRNKVLSYEGPFGVGYGCVSLSVICEDEKYKLINRLVDEKIKKIRKIRLTEDEYVKLARKSLELFVRNNNYLSVPKNSKDIRLLSDNAGVFVSIKKDGELRGCIGTIESTKENIAEEIITNAVSSGLYDPRFYPVKKEELDELVYSVDVLMPAEKIRNIKELDVTKYGVIVKKGKKTGLLLPNLEGVDTINEQVSIALKKAGINPEDDYEMERFEVVRHK